MWWESVPKSEFPGWRSTGLVSSCEGNIGNRFLSDDPQKLPSRFHGLKKNKRLLSHWEGLAEFFLQRVLNSYLLCSLFCLHFSQAP